MYKSRYSRIFYLTWRERERKSERNRRGKSVCLRIETRVLLSPSVGRLLCMNSVLNATPHLWRRRRRIQENRWRRRRMENHVEVWKIRWHARNRLKFTRGKRRVDAAAIAHRTYLSFPPDARRTDCQKMSDRSLKRKITHARFISMFQIFFFFFRLRRPSADVLKVGAHATMCCSWLNK